MSEDVRSIFLSPHFDDIALSCGGTVAARRDAGSRPEIVVIFGGQPNEALSPFAAAMADTWGIDAAEVARVRTAEERAAADRLGAEVTVLDFLDAIYRGDRYLDDGQLFGPVHPDERSLTGQILSAVVAVTATGDDRPIRWFAPCAVGSHVDHQHVYEVGRALAGRGADVAFYEDLPYALKRAELADRAVRLRADGLSPDPPVDITATFDDKVAAVGEYASQLTATFQALVEGPVDLDAVATLLRRAATAPDDGAAGRLHEHTWSLDAGTLADR